MSACALSAAEGLLLLQEETPRAETAANGGRVLPTDNGERFCCCCVHVHRERGQAAVTANILLAKPEQDGVRAREPRRRAPARLERGQSARLSAGVVYRRVHGRPSCDGAGEATRAQERRQLFGAGPVVVSAFQGTHQHSIWSYTGDTPTIHGTGQWVHVPNLSTCVRSMSRPFSLVTSEEL